MRHFGTHGPVNKEDNYVVARTERLDDFIKRIKLGRYIVLFAPRQTGKTTFFQDAIHTLEAEGADYFPIHLNFEEYEDLTPDSFYANLTNDLRIAINRTLQKRGNLPSAQLTDLLENPNITDHIATRRFFEKLPTLLVFEETGLLPPRVVLIIDEFDGVPQAAATGFLRSLRRIYLSGRDVRCPYSIGIVGVKSIAQLNYNRSISPFNIQDEFTLPNFTLEQVQALLSQYTDEVGQPFAPAVVEKLHQQTAGQPFLVNRFAQILTEELDIPKTETIQMQHFSKAHAQLLEERNTNVEHLITNVRRDPRFEKTLMRIAFYGSNINFTLHNEVISELATYGIIARGKDGMCQILNPIYLHAIIQAFKPLINGLEDEYLPDDGPIDFTGYVTETGQLDMVTLIENFNNFIARAGFRVLQVPDTPQEFVGQYLLFAYLDAFVKIVGATMYLEVPTGRGRADLIIGYKGRKYIVETKVWRNEKAYQAGKHQLAIYLTLEGETEGYYIVFDYRQKSEPRIETDTVDSCTIQSYVIPILQKVPSATTP